MTVGHDQRRLTVGQGPGWTASGCDGPVCITCADEAIEVTVVSIGADALARVDTGEGIEEVSVMLVEAAVGDRILVHAGEAIAVVRP